ncbi:MAG: FitA-like ribbon-helix-helix domain-containing protein, partial [Gammaproteobacteria bacterium]
KNLPEELHARLKEQAQRHHRSVTKEVVSLIESGLGVQRSESELPPPVELKGQKPAKKPRQSSPNQHANGVRLGRPISAGFSAGPTAVTTTPTASTTRRFSRN